MGEEWEGSGGRRCVFDCVIVCGVLATCPPRSVEILINHVIFQFHFEVFAVNEVIDMITPSMHDQNGNWKI